MASRAAVVPSIAARVLLALASRETFHVPRPTYRRVSQAT
jgi:hypothetical protein